MPKGWNLLVSASGKIAGSLDNGFQISVVAGFVAEGPDSNQLLACSSLNLAALDFASPLHAEFSLVVAMPYALEL